MSRLANNLALDLVSTTAATIFNTGNLTTTPIQYPDTSTGSPGFAVRKFIITNRHATNYITVGICATSTSPSFVASAAGIDAPTEGLAVLPLTQLVLNLKSSLSLWAAASAGSTPMQIIAYDTPVVS